MVTKENDKYLMLIKTYVYFPTDLCNLDNLLQEDCTSCPYNMHGSPCISEDYEKLGLL